MEVYPEIAVRKDADQRVTFPVDCPTCGSLIVMSDDTGWDGPIYGCGGQYTIKPQIQNHTDKWWGVCEKGQSDG